MSIKKPSETEEEYFAREEAAKQHKLVVEQQRKLAEAEKERLKALHFMHCPKCGSELKTIAFQGVQIDRCFNCHGTFLDEKEFEQLVGKEPGFLERVAAVFRRD
jgi:hypothetical protein